MKAPHIGLILILVCGVGACRRPQPAAKTSPPKRGGNIVWVNLRGATVSVPNKAAEEWEIREATFRYQLRDVGKTFCYLELISVKDGSSGQHKKKSSHSAMERIPYPPPPPPPPLPPIIETIELPDALMSRLAAIAPNVRRRSECDTTDDRGVVDKKTGQDGGVIFTVSDILWLSPTEAEVSGGSWTGNLGSCGVTYYLRKIDGKWRVVGDQLNWIS